jgi:hypothetical protein
MSEEKKKYKIEGRESTIFRVVKNKDNPYVMIDRRPIDNPKLSFKAKGILTYLLSRPDGWEVSVTDLVNHSPEGKASIRSGLIELQKQGHIKRSAERVKGRITGWLIKVYEVSQEPDSDNRIVDEPESDFQDVENQQVENRTQVLSTLSIKRNKVTTPLASQGNQTQTPSPRKFPTYINGKAVFEDA